MRQSFVLVAAVLLSACLQKEVTHTLVLTPDGGLSWMVLETDVRSDEREPAKRRAEEERFLTAAQAGVHDVGRGLARLAPLRVQTRVVRGDRPFTVVSDADFQSIDAMLRRFLTEARLEGEVVFSHQGSTTSLVIRVDAAAAMESDSSGVDDESALSALIEDFETYRIVINNGRFVTARGFEISENGQRAVPVKQPWEAIEANGGILELSLTWRR